MTESFVNYIFSFLQGPTRQLVSDLCDKCITCIISCCLSVFIYLFILVLQNSIFWFVNEKEQKNGTNNGD